MCVPLKRNCTRPAAQVGVAIANRLPQFTISGLDGYTGTSFGHLFNPADAFWTLTGGITQPIFDGGTLLHRQRGAEAAYDQAADQYESTVISAFQNVADTLHALQYDAMTLKAAVAAKNATGTTLDLTRRQLQSGTVNYLAVLSAEQAYQQAVISLIQAQTSRYADTAALFQALGGGWWNRPDLAVAEKQSSEPATQTPDSDTLSETEGLLKQSIGLDNPGKEDNDSSAFLNHASEHNSGR